MDEMPLTLNVNTGRKFKSDKKPSGYCADIVDMILSEGITATWAVDFVDKARKGSNGPTLSQDEDTGRNGPTLSEDEDTSKKSKLRGGKRARVIVRSSDKI